MINNINYFKKNSINYFFKNRKLYFNNLNYNLNTYVNINRFLFSNFTNNETANSYLEGYNKIDSSKTYGYPFESFILSSEEALILNIIDRDVLLYTSNNIYYKDEQNFCITLFNRIIKLEKLKESSRIKNAVSIFESMFVKLINNKTNIEEESINLIFKNLHKVNIKNNTIFNFFEKTKFHYLLSDIKELNSNYILKEIINSLEFLEYLVLTKYKEENSLNKRFWNEIIIFYQNVRNIINYDEDSLINASVLLIYNVVKAESIGLYKIEANNLDIIIEDIKFLSSKYISINNKVRHYKQNLLILYETASLLKKKDCDLTNTINTIINIINSNIDFSKKNISISTFSFYYLFKFVEFLDKTDINNEKLKNLIITFNSSIDFVSLNKLNKMRYKVLLVKLNLLYNDSLFKNSLINILDEDGIIDKQKLLKLIHNFEINKDKEIEDIYEYFCLIRNFDYNNEIIFLENKKTKYCLTNYKIKNCLLTFYNTI